MRPAVLSLRPRAHTRLLATLAFGAAAIIGLTAGTDGSSANGGCPHASHDTLHGVHGHVAVHPALAAGATVRWCTMVNVNWIGLGTIAFAGGPTCLLSAQIKPPPTTTVQTRIGGDLMTLALGTAFCTGTQQPQYVCLRKCQVQVWSTDPTFGMLVPPNPLPPSTGAGSGSSAPPAQVASSILCQGTIRLNASPPYGGTVVTASTEGSSSAEVTLHATTTPPSGQQIVLVPGTAGVTVTEQLGHPPTTSGYTIYARAAIRPADVCGQPNDGVPGEPITPIPF